MSRRRQTAQAPTSASGRRRGYTLRRERLGEWATVVITALAIGLWLLWPRGPYRQPRGRRLPETGAAYVTVQQSGSALALRADRFTHAAGDGLGAQDVLPLQPDYVPAPILPAPPYLEPARACLPAAKARLPTLRPPVAGPPPPALTVPPPRPDGVQLSAALRQAQFRFQPPAVTGAPPGRARFLVALGPDGHVVHVLDEESSDAILTRRWRGALLSGSGRTNAAGSVEVEWSGP
ncbi:MAG: hypothetical protein PHR35_05535 [Kiritimatiellae bacterium]|nr:hypothetical protein [Kiritimatiellia bacterium]